MISHKGLAIGIISAFLASQAMAQAQTPARATNIGVIDKDKVVISYPRAQQAADEVRKAEEHVRKLMEESNKQYDEAKAAHKPPAELEGLQRRLQAQIDEEAKKLQAKAQSLEGQLENDIDSAIKAEAASKRVDMVLLKQLTTRDASVPLVLYGGTDLTDGVIKRLVPAAAATTSGQNKATTK